jgi:hypothetical protein
MVTTVQIACQLATNHRWNSAWAAWRGLGTAQPARNRPHMAAPARITNQHDLRYFKQVRVHAVGKATKPCKRKQETGAAGVRHPFSNTKRIGCHTRTSSIARWWLAALPLGCLIVHRLRLGCLNELTVVPSASLVRRSSLCFPLNQSKVCLPPGPSLGVSVGCFRPELG